MIGIKVDQDVADWIRSLGGPLFVKHAMIRLKELQAVPEFHDAWWSKFLGEHALAYCYLTAEQLDIVNHHRKGRRASLIRAQKVGSLFRVDRASIVESEDNLFHVEEKSAR